jgi:hypothetical protein
MIGNQTNQKTYVAVGIGVLVFAALVALWWFKGASTLIKPAEFKPAKELVLPQEIKGYQNILDLVSHTDPKKEIKFVPMIFKNTGLIVISNLPDGTKIKMTSGSAKQPKITEFVMKDMLYQIPDFVSPKGPFVLRFESEPLPKEMGAVLGVFSDDGIPRIKKAADFLVK